jgi:hypothetical protein
VKSAPPEVRRWIEREAAAALAALHRFESDPSHPHAAALAARWLEMVRSTNRLA